MNPLRDDKAPYALALLLGAFGWHVSQITAEVKRSNTIAYTVTNDAATGEQLVRIDNLSSEKAVGELNFELNCPQAQECIGQVTNQAVGIVQIPVDTCFGAVDTLVRLPLPPQTSIKIVTKVLPSQPFPNLHFSPTTKTRCVQGEPIILPEGEYELTEAVIILPGTSWRAWVTRNYLAIILWTFTVTLLILLSVIVSFFLATRRSEEPVPAPAPTPRSRKRAPRKAPADA